MAAYPPWWWAIGIFIIVAVLLVVLGRLGAHMSVAGRLPPDEGPDLKASEKELEPDIPPDHQSQEPPKA